MRSMPPATNRRARDGGHPRRVAQRWRSGARTLAALVLAGGALAAFAASNDPPGASRGEPAAQQSAGAFSAALILARDDQELLGRWSGARHESVDADGVRSIAAGGRASAFVVFGGCAPDASGRCDVTMRLRVKRPDGTTAAATPPLEVWQHKAPPAARTLQLSAQYLKIEVEPSDPAGRYVVAADVKDHVSGASLQLATSFTATR